MSLSSYDSVVYSDKSVVVYRVFISSDDCQILGEREYLFDLDIRLHPHTCKFRLVAHKSGIIVINIAASKVDTAQGNQLRHLAETEVQLRVTTVSKYPADSSPPNPSNLGESRSDNRSLLLAAITTRFDSDEFRLLCFKMDIKDAELAGETINTRAANLIMYCERHGRFDELQALVRELRPNADLG